MVSKAGQRVYFLATLFLDLLNLKKRRMTPMFIIDRLEEEWAVIETEERKTFNLPRKILPAEAKEGDVIKITVEIDNEQTQIRRKKTKSLLEDFFEE
jgi:hypothetical protein